MDSANGLTGLFNIDSFLEHHGVKGMKWGVRRDRSRSNKGITKFKEKPKRLTDEELNARIKRLEQEKKYRELNKRTVSRGGKLASEVLTTIGKNTAIAAGTSAATFGVRKAIEKKFGEGVKKEMFPKK